MKYGFEFTIVQYSGGTVCSIGVTCRILQMVLLALKVTIVISSVPF